MELYKNNLMALEKRYKDICDFFSSYEEPDNVIYQIEQAKNGEPVLVYNGDNKIYFNSKYNPSAEAERYMSDFVDMPDNSVLVIFGLSNGSFVKEFLKKNNKDNYCVVYEPSIDILYALLKTTDISDILLNERFLLTVAGVNDEIFRLYIVSLIEDYNIITNQHIVVPKYSELFTDKLTDMVKLLNEVYDQKKIESNTSRSAGAICCKNEFYNMRFLEGCRAADDLTGKFPNDLPGIVVSAGPSLLKNVHLLKEAKDKALIVCTDSAVNVVLSTGVKPDMVVSIDYEKPVKLFNASILSDLPFLAGMDLNTKVLEKVNPKNLLFSSSSGTKEKLFEKVGSSCRQIEGGGSVATTAIAFLKRWGFKKIILIGQDLAFTDNKIHAEEQKEDIIDINSRDYEYVEGINGDLLPVRKDYFQYLRWIEQFAYVNEDIEIIDATEGGSKKKNTTIMTFRDAIDKYCNKTCNIEEIINSIPRLFVGDDKKYIEDELNNLNKNLLYFKGKFNKAKQLCLQGENIMKSSSYDIRSLRYINKFIGGLDNEFLDSDIALIVSKFVAQAEANLAIDMYMEESDDIKEAIRMYKKSGEYYGMIADAIPDLIKLVEESKELLQENR